MGTRTIFEIEKKCAKCLKTKSIEDFSTHKGGKFGVLGQCKSCVVIRRKEYQAVNAEELRVRRAVTYLKNQAAERARVAKYRYEHPEKARATYMRQNAKNAEKRKDWARKNKDKMKSYYLKWYAKNAIEIKSRSRNRYASDPQKHIASSISWARRNPGARSAIERNRRARVRHANGRHTDSDVRLLLDLQKGRCASCAKRIVKKYHVDHIVALANGGGNGPKDIQLLCPTCNHKKGAKCPIEFMQSKGFLL